MPSIDSPAENVVSLRPRRVTCFTYTGQTLYGITVDDASRADAILHKDVFRFGLVNTRGDDYLLTQGNDTWRFPRATTQIVMFNLLPEYRLALQQQFHQLTDDDQ